MHINYSSFLLRESFSVAERFGGNASKQKPEKKSTEYAF